MRRLPIYFLMDISESMVGEPIEQVQDGIATIIKELKTDPYALETVWISIIGFAGKSKTITPLQDVITFYPPKIPIGSGTSLSKGLTELMRAIDRDVIKTTYEKKGDWKPIIFLFTDGIPTDNTDKEILQWNTHYKNRCNLIIISIGDNTNYNLLGKLSDQVLLFNNTNTGSYKEFFKWVTASIKATSEKINTTNSEGLDLSKINSAVIEQIDITKQYQSPDNNFVVLNAKCSQTKKQYLIKFKKSFENSNIMDMQTRIYKAEGAFKIDDSTYKEFSSENNSYYKISSEELYGNPSCPCCGNNFSLATCTCSGIHCISNMGSNTCPWCGNTGFYGHSEEDFNINRTLG
ncbi:TerY-C metal binding domain-containing protein [Elizabethkingia anophelis]|uniref:TerY-C metal binding domain-containing protein n=1 Tax=Elizabethkingia anophelis TaxID=1117645 RepID=UPI003891A220